MVVPELSEDIGNKKNDVDDILELPINDHNGTVRSKARIPSIQK